MLTSEIRVIGSLMPAYNILRCTLRGLKILFLVSEDVILSS